MQEKGLKNLWISTFCAGKRLFLFARFAHSKKSGDAIRLNNLWDRPQSSLLTSIVYFFGPNFFGSFKKIQGRVLQGLETTFKLAANSQLSYWYLTMSFLPVQIFYLDQNCTITLLPDIKRHVVKGETRINGKLVFLLHVINCRFLPKLIW